METTGDTIQLLITPAAADVLVKSAPIKPTYVPREEYAGNGIGPGKPVIVGLLNIACTQMPVPFGSETLRYLHPRSYAAVTVSNSSTNDWSGSGGGFSDSVLSFTQASSRKGRHADRYRSLLSV